MDGVHDLGGMHGFGAIPIETDEPLFHEPWEGRVWAMQRAVAPTTDRFRWTIEQMPPAESHKSVTPAQVECPMVGLSASAEDRSRYTG